MTPDELRNRISQGVRRSEHKLEAAGPPAKLAQPGLVNYQGLLTVVGAPVSGYHPALVSEYHSGGNFSDRSDVPVWARTPSLLNLLSGTHYWGRCCGGVTYRNSTDPIAFSGVGLGTYVVDDPPHVLNNSLVFQMGSGSTATDITVDKPGFSGTTLFTLVGTGSGISQTFYGVVSGGVQGNLALSLVVNNTESALTLYDSFTNVVAKQEIVTSGKSSINIYYTGSGLTATSGFSGCVAINLTAVSGSSTQNNYTQTNVLVQNTTVNNTSVSQTFFNPVKSGQTNLSFSFASGTWGLTFYWSGGGKANDKNVTPTTSTDTFYPPAGGSGPNLTMGWGASGPKVGVGYLPGSGPTLAIGFDPVGQVPYVNITPDAALASGQKLINVTDTLGNLLFAVDGSGLVSGSVKGYMLASGAVGTDNWTKYTIPYTDFSTGATGTGGYKKLFTLPAQGMLQDGFSFVSKTWSGTGPPTVLDLKVGYGGSGTNIDYVIPAANGKVSGSLGTYAPIGASDPAGSIIYSMANSTEVGVTLSQTGGATVNLTAGELQVWLKSFVLP